MKLTESQLRKIIGREIASIIKEASLISEEEAVSPVKGLDWSSNYESFVSALKSNASDPKVQAFIKAGKLDQDENDDKFTFSNADLDVSGLIPTQNEIDVDKSLAWPMKTVKTFLSFVKGAGKSFELGSPIVTYQGKYVIDGHHRWSQLYACNKDAKIKAVDINVEGLEPLDVLKAVQAAIAIQTGDVPVQSVKGTNLLTIDEGALKAWLTAKATPEFLEACATDESAMNIMKSAGGVNEADEAAPAADSTFNVLNGFIWSNVSDMQAKSQPVPGAPKRDFMPQTDNVDWQKPLAAGVVDIAEPHAEPKSKQAESRESNGTPVLVERWQKIAGLIK